MGIKLHEVFTHDVKEHYAWLFWCPGCESIHQCDKRWGFNGNQEQPTFTGSVLVHGIPSINRPTCHSFVVDGKIQFLPDCTHALTGQTVDLPDWSENAFRKSHHL